MGRPPTPTPTATATATTSTQLPLLTKMDAPTPCRTLYVRNLPDKLPRQKLRQLLHAGFSTHGKVVWISAEKSKKLRGQAFITFEQQSSATTALHALQSTQFMSKTLQIAYSRQETDRSQGIEFGGQSTDSIKTRATKRRRIQPPSPSLAHAQGEDGRKEKEKDAEVVVQPNNILFVQHLPNGSDLKELFARFAGFVEVRSVPGKTDIAFVEFATDAQAAIAMSGLHGQLVGNPQQPISVTFAKK